MNKRIVAIAFIFVSTSIAWMVLGGTIFARTESVGLSSESRVESTWGSRQIQRPAEARWYERVVDEQPVTEGNKTVIRRSVTTKTVNLDVEQSRVKVNFNLDHRKKGLLWYSTYSVDFAGEYLFRNDTDEAHAITFRFPLPAQNAVYDNLSLKINGAPLKFSTAANAVTGDVSIPPHEAARLTAAYHSQGMDDWRYSFGENVSSVRDFQLEMSTNFKQIDFPDNTLSPTHKEQTDNGWKLTWNYKNLISGFQVGMKMPDKLQPGPLAGKISFFAPVSLFFFFFVIVHSLHDSRHRSAPDELFLYCCRVFRLPPAARLSGRSHLDSPCIRDLLGCIDFSRGELSQASGRKQICDARGGTCATCVPRAVFLCLLLRGLYWIVDHNWRDRNVVHRYADNRPDQLGRAIPEASGIFLGAVEGLIGGQETAAAEQIAAEVLFFFLWRSAPKSGATHPSNRNTGACWGPRLRAGPRQSGCD